MSKMNCWEFLECERELGGHKAGEFGVCPAAIETKVDGINGGKNGGRSCWAIAGTLCGGEVQGSFALKFQDCLKCEFYQFVKKEEGTSLCLSATILGKLRA